jgi:ribonuclease HII
MDAGRMEAGVDEAGRGSLAGPVVAAAVVWNPHAVLTPAELSLIRDSKKLSRAQRDRARSIIEAQAVAWSVAFVSAAEIDRKNILNATHSAMHLALDRLDVTVDMILVDGDRFRPYLRPSDAELVNHVCVVDGDAQYASIAAASILAKTHRDDYVASALHPRFPYYGFDKHFGYGTARHMHALATWGASPEHRKTFAPVRRVHGSDQGTGQHAAAVD